MLHTKHGSNLFLKFDPRCLIICAFILCATAACLTQMHAALAALAIALIILAISRPANIFRRILAANFFIAFIWLFVPFSLPGNSLWHWGILNLTSDGIRLATLVTIKANAVIFIFLAMLSPLKITAWSNALHDLRCPQKLVWIFLLMGRNIFMLQNQWHAMHEAARLRGYRAGTSPHSYRIMASMLAFLLIRASDRAQVIHEAMLLRGFSGHLPRYEEMQMVGRDYFLFLMVAVSVVGLLFIQFNGSFPSS